MCPFLQKGADCSGRSLPERKSLEQRAVAVVAQVAEGAFGRPRPRVAHAHRRRPSRRARLHAAAIAVRVGCKPGAQVGVHQAGDDTHGRTLCQTSQHPTSIKEACKDDLSRPHRSQAQHRRVAGSVRGTDRYKHGGDALRDHLDASDQAECPEEPARRNRGERCDRFAGRSGARGARRAKPGRKANRDREAMSGSGAKKGRKANRGRRAKTARRSPTRTSPRPAR